MRYCPICHRCFHEGVEFCLFDQSPTREGAGLPLIIDGKYQLECLIAHGGMGSVYRAMHLQLERPVAVKILRAEFLADEKVRERFHREALAAARLKHPNIIAIYDFGSLSQGSAYIVMELVEGRSLRQELRTLASPSGQRSRADRQGKTLRPERAAAIMRQVCAGVEAAHRSGIIHRDLKPDNIMIETAPDGSERILVLDFGIAKLKQPQGVVQCLTDEETIIGTPNYISPEQCTGLPADVRSDVYALGVILYEMLTGQVPFSNSSTSAVLLSHLQETPAPPTRFRLDLNTAIEGVVLRALAKSPQHRFASAAQLAESLTKAVLLGERSLGEAVSEDEWDEPVTRPRLLPVPPAAPVEAFVTTEPELVNDTPMPVVAPVSFVPTPALAQQPEPSYPKLLIERRSRRGLYVVVTAVTLLSVGALADFNSGWMQGRLTGLVQSLSPSAAKMSQPGESLDELSASLPVTVASPTPPVEALASKSVVPAAASEVELGQPLPSPSPGALVKTSGTVLPEAERVAQLRNDLKIFYRGWAETALQANWTDHSKYYAGQVTYYNEGALARTQVVARKRRVFSGLDKYYLKFAGDPQITLIPKSDPPEAQMTFDKQWDLQRGQQRTAGKSLTQIVLRYEKQQWLIVNEKQLKLYHQSASVNRAAAPAAARKKQAANKPRRQVMLKSVRPAPRSAKARKK